MKLKNNDFLRLEPRHLHISSKFTVYGYLLIFTFLALTQAIPISFVIRLRTQFWTDCDLSAKDCQGNFAEEAFWNTLFDSLNYFLSFLFTGYLTILSDKCGRKPILLFSVFMTSLPYLALSCSSNMWWYYSTKGLKGISGSYFGYLDVIIADLVPGESRGTYFGLTYAFFGFGFAVGPYIGNYLVTFLSEQETILVATSVTWFALVFIMFLPEPEKPEDLLSKPNETFLNKVKQVLQSKLLSLAAIISFSTNVAETAAIDIILNYFADALALDKDDQSSFNSMFLMIGGVSLPVVMALIFPFLTRCFSLQSILIFSCLIATIHQFLYAFLPIFHDLNSIYATRLLTTGISNMICPSLYGMLSQMHTASDQTKVLGYLASVESFTKCIGPFCFGYFYRSTSHIFPGLWLVLAGFLCSIGFFVSVCCFEGEISKVPTVQHEINYIGSKLDD